MAAPVVYPVAAQVNGCALETAAAPGTPVAMTNTVPVDTFKWEDKPAWADDKAPRGVMGTDSFNVVQLVKYCDVSAIGGPVYADTIGFPAANALGDVTTTGTAAPYKHVISLLNPTSAAPTGQGRTLTWTHYNGVKPTVGGIYVPYFCLSQFVLTWDFATGMLMWSGKGQGWASSALAARPTAAPSAIKPFAGWVGQLGVGGTVTGNSVTNLEKATFTVNRELENEFTGNGQQNPLAIARGGLACTFDLQFIAQDDTYYTDMINNTQPQLQALFSTGTGGTLTSVQVDMQQAAFTKVMADYSKKMVRWTVSGKGVFNSTNVGASGGLAPIQLTLQNAVISGTYA